MNATGLVLRNVQKRFPGFELGPLSLTFARGHVYGLLGPNGAGKTTLLNLITLQAQASSGEMSFGDVPIRWGDAWWKERFAYVRESPSFYAELTVGETMRLAARLYGRWDADLASRMTARLGLEKDRSVRTLSKGTRIKLGIASALAHRAEVLILDEPTAGVDPSAREELHEILTELRQERADLCVVLSSHIFEDLEALADEVLILRDGKVVAQPGQDELRSGALAAAYRATARPRKEAS